MKPQRAEGPLYRHHRLASGDRPPAMSKAHPAAGHVKVTFEKVRQMRKTKSAFMGLCISLAFSASIFGQNTRSNDNIKSCRAFVGHFYAWYQEQASTKDNMRASSLALKHRPYLFSPELARRIKQDYDAQEKAGSDLVSLDADPFGGPDGLGDGHIVERVSIKDGKCLAEVHAVWQGKEDESPDATPELIPKGDSWIFVNFYYPSPASPNAQDLLSELKAFREMRKRFKSAKDKKMQARSTEIRPPMISLGTDPHKTPTMRAKSFSGPAYQPFGATIPVSGKIDTPLHRLSRKHRPSL